MISHKFNKLKSGRINNKINTDEEMIIYESAILNNCIFKTN